MEFESSIGKTVVDGERRKVLTVDDEQGTEGGSFVVPAENETYPEREGGNLELRPGGDDSFVQPITKRLSDDEAKDLFARRKAILDEEKRVNPILKKKVEVLTGIGRETDTVEVGSDKISIRTLKAKESKALAKLAELFNAVSPVDFVFDIREQTLARSVYAINGVKVEDIIDSDDIQDKVDLLNELGDPAIAYLHERYTVLATKAREKYSVRTNEEAKEVAEAVKKP